ncbi:hypothetical protein EPK99_01430 [Neorhizobium lilium]|uniref:AcrB/AcrD/AcrF family protein n=1 Tax=Neorhizobium lilium TaxID=2503024 RepID=A0A444LND1_9HYPH|nr:efflux RND transporter permease subunit [Neorhizobium lilium]RWX81846.1 hypothetical protein EPK99_01430 [Neorhizobium lilium]
MHRAAGHREGASSETQNATGTGLFGGMISATLFAMLFVPVFYAIVIDDPKSKAKALKQSRASSQSIGTAPIDIKFLPPLRTKT